MNSEKFDNIAELTLSKMEEEAKRMGVKGVAVVANLEEGDSISWASRMRVAGSMRTPADEEGEYFNFVGVAYAKMSEMMDTKQDSGSGIRPKIWGELGYQGGAIRSHDGGYIAAAFSGASSEDDYLISVAALDFIENC